MSHPVIRRRVPKSQRRRDGLIQFARDNTSQNGEDGIIDKIFQILPLKSNRFCVDVGAWDGKHLSNTYSLLIDNEGDSKWQGMLIEADEERFKELSDLHLPLGNICINTTVSCKSGSKEGLVTILQSHGSNITRDFDFLCIDVDGSDYWLLHDVWEAGYRPKVVCIEANPTMPNDLVYIPSRSDIVRHGASLSALVELATENGYVLIETTLYNAFFVPQELYHDFFLDLVPDPSIEALHELTMGTSIYQLYDGTLKLWGCKRMLWHRLPMDEMKMQILPPSERHFPFAPQPSNTNIVPDTHVIDISAYCSESTSPRSKNELESCAKAIVGQLKSDGFAFIRGTGISAEVCQEALSRTHSFLQEADESVRRSCLTKDRARRGYSPQNTENFASLIGEHGRNDLVRKFRMGPTGEQNQESSESPLLNPNVWPSPDCWDEVSCSLFREAVELYYGEISRVAHVLVQAICDGIIHERPELSSSLKAISMNESISHTSILTLLGYRKGTRHKKTRKNSQLGNPLVAAHTDVGVITVLLFDKGDCAVLQREASSTTNLQSSTRKDEKLWVDVNLPSIIPEDPIFVVNIADCLSELCENYLPSTLHRVMPETGSTPRNCLALFVGLEPQKSLTFTSKNQVMTYEDWRKKRIAKAQKVLQMNHE